MPQLWALRRGPWNESGGGSTPGRCPYLSAEAQAPTLDAVPEGPTFRRHREAADARRQNRCCPPGSGSGVWSRLTGQNALCDGCFFSESFCLTFKALVQEMILDDCLHSEALPSSVGLEWEAALPRGGGLFQAVWVCRGGGHGIPGHTESPPWAGEGCPVPQTPRGPLASSFLAEVPMPSPPGHSWLCSTGIHALKRPVGWDRGPCL